MSQISENTWWIFVSIFSSRAQLPNSVGKYPGNPDPGISGLEKCPKSRDIPGFYRFPGSRSRENGKNGPKSRDHGIPGSRFPTLIWVLVIQCRLKPTSKQMPRDFKYVSKTWKFISRPKNRKVFPLSPCKKTFSDLHWFRSLLLNSVVRRNMAPDEISSLALL